MTTQPPPPPSLDPGPLRPVRTADDTARTRDRDPIAYVAMGPLVLAAVLGVIAPSFWAPLLDDTVTLAGLPMIVPVLLLFAAAELLVAWLSLRVNPWIGVAAAAVWVSIGVSVVILGPAIVLIIGAMRDSGP